MSNTPLASTVPPTNPNDNPNPDDMPPANIGHPIKLDPGVTFQTGHNGGDDDNGDGGKGDGNNGDKCAEYLEELVQRLGNLDAEAYCAAKLLEEIPRDPSPSAEVPMRRLWRMVERVAGDVGAALQYAEAAVAIVRGSRRKRGGNNDDTGSGGGQS